MDSWALYQITYLGKAKAQNLSDSRVFYVVFDNTN